ncbi:MAG: aminoglycoside phosphotransferase family protein, partial [Tenericutes bacterium]|nr:aminoglycoside phosphotransferase family protein [Mycoplasmatota bacterium]
FDPNELFVTIPDFHDTPKRYEALRKAIDIDNYDRAINVYNEIKFIMNRKDKLSIVTDALEKKEIPLRVTHNDTKLNNIMIDKDSKKAVCVIDLDTVMPGSALYDFGDAVRIGASTAKEDEKDVSKIHLNIELFEAFTKGFFKEALAILTPLEIDLLVDSVWLITMEITMRFLTDYLENDQYFKIDYAEHNIVRVHAQMKLVEEIEKHYDEMKMIVERLIKE